MFDAGDHISELKAASVKRYIMRLAANSPAHCNQLLEYAGQRQ